MIIILDILILDLLIIKKNQNNKIDLYIIALLLKYLF